MREREEESIEIVKLDRKKQRAEGRRQKAEGRSREGGGPRGGRLNTQKGGKEREEAKGVNRSRGEKKSK